jgi:DNA-binding transcriptional ArsR family regulator
MKCKDGAMALPDDLGRMADKAKEVASFLKGLASEHRLLILCRLVEGEASVAQLIAATGLAPTSMSQHLGKLKDEGVVAVRRDHRTLHYRIAHPAAMEVLRTLHRHFCAEAEDRPGGGLSPG